MKTGISLVTTKLARSSAKGSPFKLFNYQIAAIENVLEAARNGIKRTVVVLATGGGKTVLFSHLLALLEPHARSEAPPRGNRTLVLAHRSELIFQAANTIQLANPELKVSIDMAERKYDADANVIVASVPTLIHKSRLEKYDPLKFKSIILDECHHSAANSWKKILNYFGADTPDTEVNVVGFTATYERADDKDLNEIYDKVVYRRSLLKMIQEKQLCDMLFLKVKGLYSLDGVSNYQGDYNTRQLEVAVNNARNNTLIADAYLRLKKKYKFKSTIIFCAGIAHCESVCTLLQKEGVNAQYITSNTTKQARKELIKDFSEGKIDVLCNVVVFTEGFDVPRIDSIILARPTKSRVLIQQMVGRGLRNYEDKSVCYVADVSGTQGTMISVMSLVPDGYAAMDDVEGKKFTEVCGTLTPSAPKPSLEDDMFSYLLLTSSKEMETLKITEVGGVSELSNFKISPQDSEAIKNYLMNQPGNWIWLDSHQWALRTTDDTFILLKIGSKFETSLRKLNLTRFNGIFNERTSVVQMWGTPSTNLVEAVKNMKTLHPKMQDWTKMLNQGITTGQCEYIEGKLEKKLKKMYPRDLAVFSDNLRKKSRLFGSNLIFAFRYSMSVKVLPIMIKHVIETKV